MGELRARGRPFVARVRVGADDAVGEELERLGMRDEDGKTLPGMALHPIAVPDPAGLPEGFVIRQVTDAAGLADHYAIVVEAFGLPLEFARGIMPVEALAHESLYVGYVDGEPAATALTYTGDGTVGIYNVATREAWRRRGFGAAITRHAILDAAVDGATVAILQSSAAGRGVYESLGFREVVRYRILADAAGTRGRQRPGLAAGEPNAPPYAGEGTAQHAQVPSAVPTTAPAASQQGSDAWPRTASVTSRPVEVPLERREPVVERAQARDPLVDRGPARRDQGRQGGVRVEAVARVAPGRDLRRVRGGDVEAAQVDQQAKVLDVLGRVLAVRVRLPRGPRQPPRALVEPDGVRRHADPVRKLADPHVRSTLPGGFAVNRSAAAPAANGGAPARGPRRLRLGRDQRLQQPQRAAESHLPGPAR